MTPEDLFVWSVAGAFAIVALGGALAIARSLWDSL